MIEPTLNQAHNTLTFIRYMIETKQEQIKIEPDVLMWKNELNQLLNVKELIEMDLEVFKK